MNKLLRIGIFFISMALIGCATSYQPLKSGVGYSDLQLNTTTYKVSYAGSRKISIDTVHDFLLLRCAELTLEKGYKYFIIHESKTSHLDSYYSPAITSLPYTVTLRASEITVIIELTNTNVKNGYDAALLKKSLGDKYA